MRNHGNHVILEFIKFWKICTFGKYTHVKTFEIFSLKLLGICNFEDEKYRKTHNV